MSENINIKRYLTWNRENTPVVISRTVSVDLESAEKGSPILVPNFTNIVSEKLNQEIIMSLILNGVFLAKNQIEFRNGVINAVNAAIRPLISESIANYFEKTGGAISQYELDGIITPETNEE